MTNYKQKLDFTANFIAENLESLFYKKRNFRTAVVKLDYALWLKIIT